MKIKNIFLTVMIIFLLTITVKTALAEDDLAADDLFSEEDLFSGDMFIDEEDVVTENAAADLNEQGLSITGELTTQLVYNRNQPDESWLNLGVIDQEDFAAKINADLFFDARLKNRLKGFMALGLSYNHSDEGKEEINSNIKELFIDLPYNNQIYFKVGKQVLQWGRSYFWNPTDLINVARKDIIDPDKKQEGIEGLKIHLPYGVEKNIYFFINANEIDKIADVALSGKYEFLSGKTEMSFSTWLKKDAKPVYGFDLSSRVGDIDVRGEISLSDGDNNYIMDYDTLDVYQIDNRWISRASAGFTKYFDLGDVNDKVSLTGEFYYNSAGYDKNIFLRIDNEPDENKRNAKKIEYLERVYQPNLNSKYYAAFFTQIKKFISSDGSLNLNGVINLVDYSKILTAVFSYEVQTDLTVNTNITKFIGGKNTEAGLMGSDFIFGIGTNYRF